MNFSRLLLPVLCFFVVLPGKASSQYSNVWAFGVNAGINFNTSPPQAITTGINTSEGSASMCDSMGHLLLYTDGTTVWDRNHNVMPDGADLPDVGLNITGSTSQGTIIVTKPGSHTQYYIFSLGKFEATAAGYFGKLYYSLVDMTLNGGLGNVVTTQKGILMDSLLTEHMTAVSGNNCNIWLLVFSRSDNVFKAYSIDFNGIDFNPVLSTGIPAPGTPFPLGVGNMDMANDRSRLALSLDKLYLYQFDPDLGNITNPVVLDTNTRYYGVSFSPDDSKLYAGIDYPNTINQFDLTSGDSLQMATSRTFIATGPGFAGAIKRAPDGKVYYCIRSSDTGIALSVINFPNLAGTACQVVVNGFPLAPGTSSLFGLPNLTMIAGKRHFYTAQTDTVNCKTSHLMTAGNLTGINYIWEDGSTGPTRLVTSSGTYWVKYQVNSPCIFDEYTDTVKVFFDFSIQNIITYTSHTGMCKADSFLMVASNLTGTGYTWDDASTGTQRTMNQTGTYWVTYDIDSLCKHFADTFRLIYPLNDYQVAFTCDSIVCAGNPVIFQNTSDPHFTGFRWIFNAQSSSLLVSPSFAFTQSGNYEVKLTGTINGICPDTIVKTILVDTVFPVSFELDKEKICTGASVIFSPQTDVTLTGLVFDFGDQTALSFSNTPVVFHAYDNSGIKPVQLTASFRACADNHYTDTVYVYDLPLVDIGPDTGLCLNGPAIFLKNSKESPAGEYTRLWNTGDTTALLKVVHPGTYSLTVTTNPPGCSTTDQVTVHKDCYIDIPNVFSPNNDGVNDYFFPRQLLSQKVTAFKMQVLNRWGQSVFETQNTNGRGWDGAFNGKIQPEGVYIYLIDAQINGSVMEKYQGNVTLIR